MNNQIRFGFRRMALLVVALALHLASPLVQAVDADAAKALATQNNCFKCHAFHRDKGGAAFHKVAERLKGNADAETRMIDRVTSGKNARFPDGHEEKHKIVKTSPPKDMEQVKNLVDWILIQ